MAGEETKRKLIEVAYRVLDEQGVEGLKARDIAQEAGCTAGLIYKYFGSLNYLSVMASLRIIKRYNEKCIPISHLKCDSISRNLRAWREFLTCAFRHPQIYENLFWGKGKQLFDEAIVEYFELYPEEFHDASSAFLYSTLFNISLQERELIWMRRGVHEGMIDMEDALFVSQTNCMLVHASLVDHFEDYKEPGVAEQAAKECFDLLYKNIRRFLKKPLDI